MQKVNILICGHKECLGDKMDLPGIKKHFQKKGHRVIIHSNFCDEIRDTKEFVLPFGDSVNPVVFAGCSPLVMERRIKALFDVPVEIANIREQCAWVYEKSDIADKHCIDIIELAISNVKYTRQFTHPSNILSERLAKYVSLIEEFGPNPFKI
ncbi:MAG: CoB--CoM heterodisulfide reductase subunit [Clostridiales bacterium]|jgi:heterodisulfide reductase subunit A-like polyferredoxin|nr:CoB--CoM heterodisulfide reductase subunit [Clostridiales bacterium]